MATELQLEIAAKLKELGSQKAVVELGYNKGTVSKIAKKLKKGWKPEEEETFRNVETASPAEASEGGPLRSRKVVGRAIEVGKITISPENWSVKASGSLDAATIPPEGKEKDQIRPRDRVPTLAASRTIAPRLRVTSRLALLDRLWVIA